MLDRARRPIGMFGVLETDDPLVGIVWALTTDSVREYPRPFHVQSRQWLDRVQERFPFITNQIWAGNLNHLLWLRHLGFTLLGEREIGGATFYEFVRCKYV